LGVTIGGSGEKVEGLEAKNELGVWKFPILANTFNGIALNYIFFMGIYFTGSGEVPVRSPGPFLNKIVYITFTIHCALQYGTLTFLQIMGPGGC